jgi:hypothetical protein
MYLAAVGYLKQNPRHEKIGAMRDQLLSRMQEPNCLSKASEVHLSKLPQDVLIQLPPTILSQLPPKILSKLPPKILSKLPQDVLIQLPPTILSKLPPTILSNLPPDILSQLPQDVLIQLPPAILSKLPPAFLSKLPPAFLSKLPPSVFASSPPFKNSVGMSFKLLPYGPNGAFSIGVYEVTQQQYEAVMGSNPSKFRGANNPVENVSWDDAVAYCAKLSSLRAEVAAGRVYRLPTAAESEYACRAGTTTEYSFGDDQQDLGKYAWFDTNSGATTHVVGEKLPNGWGLYDMHGNVSEWCSDGEGSYRVYRVYRGGSWYFSAGCCRSAFRSSHVPSFRDSDLGFRLALSSSGQ